MSIDLYTDRRGGRDLGVSIATVRSRTRWYSGSCCAWNKFILINMLGVFGYLYELSALAGISVAVSLSESVRISPDSESESGSLYP